MTDTSGIEGRIALWLDELEAGTHFPERLLSEAFGHTRRLPQARSFRRNPFPRLRSWASAAAVGGVALVLVAVGSVGLNLASNQPSPSAPPSPSPRAGRIACGDLTGALFSGIGCSRDGTRRLIEKINGDLFILHTDGSESLVTVQPSGFSKILGWDRPRGATISPDGNRVVFAGLTQVGRSCHDGALFSVAADGGPADVLWTSHVPTSGIVRYPTFSPDGTRIAYVDDYCDRLATVWVMSADGSEALQIVGPIGCGHVYGLAWSPDGDRIALLAEDCEENNGVIVVQTYTFAPDGSGFTHVSGAAEFCWPGWRC